MLPSAHTATGQLTTRLSLPSTLSHSPSTASGPRPSSSVRRRPSHVSFCGISSYLVSMPLHLVPSWLRPSYSQRWCLCWQCACTSYEPTCTTTACPATQPLAQTACSKAACLISNESTAVWQQRALTRATPCLGRWRVAGPRSGWAAQRQPSSRTGSTS